MGKKRVIPTEQLSADGQRVFDALNGGNDLAVVLVGASYIDAALASMLERFLIESSVSAAILEPSRGVLGSFSVRGDLCYCLGLIDKSTYQDVQVIAQVRNLFAHAHRELSFDDDEVRRAVLSLKYVEGMFPTTETSAPAGPDFPSVMANPRYRFSLTVTLLSQRLLVDALGLKRRDARPALRVGQGISV